MNTLCVRQARNTLNDAAIVHDLERRTLGDSDYTAQEMLAVLRRPNHTLYLADCQGSAAGFCSCFETMSGGARRLEIDLLGVAAEYRNRGIARHLISQAMSKARERGITSFRGVVKTDNIASQKAFSAAGMARSSEIYDLTVYLIQGRESLGSTPDDCFWRYKADPGTEGAHGAIHGQPATGTLTQGEKVVGRVHTLNVSTLTYCGLWVEQAESRTARVEKVMARALVEEAKALNLDEVGYLVPRSMPEQSRLVWLREGYQSIGAYYQYR